MIFQQSMHIERIFHAIFTDAHIRWGQSSRGAWRDAVDQVQVSL